MRKPHVLSASTASLMLFMFGMAAAQDSGPAAAPAAEQSSVAETAWQPGCAALTNAQDAWQAHPTAAGVELAYLVGRPAEAGFFKYRLRFPSGFEAASHTHSVDLHMTVLCGGVRLGLPDQPAVELAAGAHRRFPAGMLHSEASVHGAVLEITGIGPVVTTAVADTAAKGAAAANAADR